jgi:hypothetical protein
MTTMYVKPFYAAWFIRTPRHIETEHIEAI